MSTKKPFAITTLDDCEFAKDRQENIAKQLRYKYPFSSWLLLAAVKNILDGKEFESGLPASRDVVPDENNSWHWALRELWELEHFLEWTPDISDAIKRGQHI